MAEKISDYRDFISFIYLNTKTKPVGSYILQEPFWYSFSCSSPFGTAGAGNGSFCRW